MYEPYERYDSRPSAYESGRQQFFSKTYGAMAVGLLITGLVAYLVSALAPQLAYNPAVVLLLAVAQIVVVLVFSRRVMSASYQAALGMYVLYTVLTGVTFSTVFLAFDISSIALCFAATAVAFGVMAFVGHTTKTDLSPLRGILFGGLIALILVTLVGVLLRSAMLDILVSSIGVVLFLGLTAYDAQKIGRIYDEMGQSTVAGNLAVYGALELYLDFINLFLYLLRLFGRQRN